MSNSRFGLGPVFAYEWVSSTRRRQMYCARSLFVLVLLAALATIWLNTDRSANSVSAIRFMAVLRERFFVGVIGTQLALVLLVAPATTAGAICVDRARGTLTHMLVTDLSAAEIVLGKLAARLAPVLGVLACMLPVLEILSLLGAVDPNALLAGFLVTAGVAVLGCSLALTFSLWAGKTHQALLWTYSVLLLWLLSGPMTDVLASIRGWPRLWLPWSLQPIFMAVAPYWRPGAVGSVDYLLFLAMTGSFSAGLAAVAMLRIRAVCTHDRSRVARPLRASVRRKNILSLISKIVPWLRVSLDGNPIVWLEWRRSRLSRQMLLLTIAYAGLPILFGGVSILFSRALALPIVNGLQVSIGLLVLGVTAATSLAEERASGSLDLLLSTPLLARQIVVGYWLGVLRKAPLVAILPALLLVASEFYKYAMVGWRPLLLFVYVLCAGGAIASVGLAMATRFPQPGRAVGATVAAWVLFMAFWPALAVLLAGPRGDRLVIGSPFFWAAMATDVRPMLFFVPVSWELFWIVFYGLFGLGLLLSTIRSFERRLERVDDEPAWLCLPSRTLQLVTTIYFTWGVAFTLFLSSSPPDSSLLPIGTGVIFSLGLLLLAVRGSSPQAGGGWRVSARSPTGSRTLTRSLLFARWAVAATVLPWVIILPFSVAFYASDAGPVYWERLSILFAFVVAVCLAAVSLGVAIWAWCRVGVRAIIMTVTLWVLLNIGWIALGSVGFRHHFDQARTSVDPFFDVITLVLWANELNASELRPLVWMLAASAAYGAGGGLLMVLLSRFAPRNGVLSASERRYPHAYRRPEGYA